MLAEAGFWILLGLVVYVYAGYPVGVSVFALFRNRRVVKADREPTITVVIAAFNEEAEIGRTISNILSQNYPPERLNVIAVSDASTDATDEILADLAGRSAGRLTVQCQEVRQGKTAALNLAVSRATAEIIVFADANSFYAPGALRALVRSFADPSVGYVTGRMSYTNATGSGVGEGNRIYMRYENFIRTRETRLGSIVGVDGGIDAIRRDLFVTMRPDQLPDLILPLSVVEQGRRVVYEPDAVLFEPALARASDEFRMRVRVALRALWALYDKRVLLNPIRYPLYSWQIISHKVVRYVAFIPLVGLFGYNAWVAGRHPFYGGVFAVQLACYALAVLGHLFRNSSMGFRQLFTPYYFCVVNAACMVALWKFLTRQKMTVWKPRVGDEAPYRAPMTWGEPGPGRTGNGMD
jgi:cellulose synthase/poly-beta-1,6-N-acetylglucosamine synthase-like glycosyltransferase